MSSAGRAARPLAMLLAGLAAAVPGPSPARAQAAPEAPPVDAAVPPLVVARCPAAGAARLGESAALLERRAVEAAADEDRECAAHGLALADALHRAGRGACSAADRIANGPQQPPDADLLAWHALLSWRCGRPRDAWNSARAALALDERTTLAWTTLGRVLSARFRPRAARAALERALALDPQETGALLALSRIAEGRAASRALLARYLDAAPARGEPPDRVRAARETLDFLELLGERPIWTLEKAELPGTLPLEPYAVRPGQVNGWIVRLGLDEKGSVPALFDSGASGLHLADNAARKLALQPVSSGTLVGGGGDKEHGVERAIVPRLDFGPVRFADALGVVAEGSLHPQGVYRAIVGFDVLGGTRIRFDAAAMTATIEEAAAVEDGDDPLALDPWPAAPRVPIVEVEGQLLVPARLTGPTGAVEGLALLDTGASRTLIDLSAAEEIATLTQRGQRSASAYGGQVAFAGVLPAVRVSAAGADEAVREAGVIDLADRARHAGVGLVAFIGLDLLGRGTLEVDLASGTALLAIAPASGKGR
ncbi:MAG: aspartyl protease family protein [Acidobacteria bacterium]|jgi:tetratricopeptide (TPR) repeat protein|nr:aspartyl protease family protein [Acidobacteriota bacterium]